MARGRKAKSRRKSPRTVSLWNLGVGWVYLTAFTKMSTGCSGPISFLMGDYDLKWIGAGDEPGYGSLEIPIGNESRPGAY